MSLALAVCADRIRRTSMPELLDSEEALLNSQLDRVSHAWASLVRTAWTVFAVFIASQSLLAISMANVMRMPEVPAGPAVLLSGTGVAVAVLWWVLLRSCFRTLARHDALITELEAELYLPETFCVSQDLNPFPLRAAHRSGHADLVMGLTVAVAIVAWVAAGWWSVRALFA